MSDPMDALGGRLPLLNTRELSPAQMKVHERLNATMIPWAEGAGFQSKTEDGRLIGPFNPVLFSPGISLAFLALQEAEQSSTSLSKRVREVVILTVGAVWKAAYELYAHQAVARKAGISDEAIRALTAGRPSDELSAEEKTAQQYVWRLATEHRVDDTLYRAAEQAFGHSGLLDIAYLAGIYQLVCGILNSFAIPAPPSEGSSNVNKTAGPEPEIPKATLTIAAWFPEKYFLENLAIREDNSALVSAMVQNELWYVPPLGGSLPVEPVRIHVYDEPTLGIVEVEPDIFYLGTSNLYTTHESYLHRIDMRGWTPGQPVKTERVLRFPAEARGLNGSCLIAPKVLLVADCFGGFIWRVDLPLDDGPPSARVWLRHHSMDSDPNGPDWTQPGVNGLKFNAATQYLYFTSTAKQLFMRVPVTPATLEAAGPPEFVSGGRMADDFVIDERAGVAYLTTHRQNTIDRVPLEPRDNADFARNSVAGDPFTDELIGPSAGAWGRGPGEAGRVAYFISDGGTKSPPKDGPRPAKLLRVAFA